MRILAVTPRYVPEGGGLERYAHAILSRLARDGHHVTVSTFTRAGPGRTNIDGLEVHRERPLVWAGNAPFAPRWGRTLGRLVADTRPDVVVAHSPTPFPAEMAFRAARRAGVPFVLTYHAGRLRGATLARDAAAALHRVTWERSMIHGADGLIAVSPFVQDHALANAPVRPMVIPPGVDTATYAPGRDAPARRILFVGPLDSAYRWKGLDTLWRAHAILHRALGPVGLTLVGTGNRTAEFRRKARGRPEVRLVGHVPEGELVEEYRRAAVTVLPSRTDAEAFGMVLAEANACGRPVVGAAVGGIPDFVHHGENGFLVRPGDAGDLAAKLLRVLTNARLAARMGRNGRARVVREHDWDRLAARTAAVLETAVASRGGGIVAAALLERRPAQGA